MSNTLLLLMNLGTPDAPTPKAVKKYLAEFLIDPRVVELPKWLWWPILHGFVLNTRPKKSAHAYQKIWLNEGSPLLVYTQKLTQRLQEAMPQMRVDFAMRYGNPNIESVLKKYPSIKKIIALPLYPQYASSSTGSSLAALMNYFKSQRAIPELHWISSYHNHPNYINALAQQVQDHWQKNNRGQKLLLSFHGIPKYGCEQGDPYLQECQTTAELLAQALALKTEEYLVVFQSRFGKTQWLEPYCDKTLMQLPNQGIKHIDIFCPGFAVDCLETLEEINMQNRALFMQAGGEHYQYIPCLNHSDRQVQLLQTLVDT